MPDSAALINPVDRRRTLWTTLTFDRTVSGQWAGKNAEQGREGRFLPDWLLRIEAVNFAASMDDTSDLSTQRGASLTALDAGVVVQLFLGEQFPGQKVETIFIGASQALFRLSGLADVTPVLRQVRERLRLDQENPANRPVYGAKEAAPLSRMTFVVAAVEECPDALAAVEAAVKRLQFQSPTLAPHPAVKPGSQSAPVHRRACPIERRLPADARHSVRKDMLDEAVVVEVKPHDEKEVLVARSVAERRSYGRSARQRFYDKQLGARTGLHFADGLVDLVNAPPDALPLPLRGKMAVISADGIGFGELLSRKREQVGDAIEGTREFCEEVEAVNKDRILRPLIELLTVAAADEKPPRAVSLPWAEADNPEARQKKWSPILRFETLTYAGEDIVWLVPSWLAWEVVGLLFEATKGAVIAKQAPAYRVGCVVCSHKVPIRKAKGLAHELAYLVTEGVVEKAAGLQLELVESIDVSDGYLGAHRARLAGAAGPERFTIAAASHAAVEKHVRALRHPKGLPPSQLHRLLRLAAQRRAFTDAAGRAEVLDELKKTLERGGYHYGAGGDTLTVEHLACEALGAEADALFGLLRLAQLWDVVLPLGQPVLRMPGQ